MKSTALILKAAFDRKKKEKKISIQSIADRLDISRSLLSQILSGKRSLPAEKLEALCSILDLDKEKRDAIARSLLNRKRLPQDLGLLEQLNRGALETPKKATWSFLTKDQFPILQDWFYLAILETTLLHDYDGTSDFIVQRLKIPKSDVERALQLLKKKQLLEIQGNGRWVKKNNLCDAFSGANKKEIRAYHQSSLKKASEALSKYTEESDVQSRLVTGLIVSISSDRIAWVKQKIVDLLREVAEDASQMPADEVYQLSAQFFPLTRK